MQILTAPCTASTSCGVGGMAAAATIRRLHWHAGCSHFELVCGQSLPGKIAVPVSVTRCCRVSFRQDLLCDFNQEE